MTPSEALQDERAAARRLIDDLQTELAGILLEQEANPPDDEHDVEGSSVGYERARVTALLAHAEGRLTELEAAAGRIASGTYGSCARCGGPIGDDRLAAVPTTSMCLACASSCEEHVQRLERLPPSDVRRHKAEIDTAIDRT